MLRIVRVLGAAALGLVVAACGGVREHAAAIAPPSPSGASASADVQLSIQRAIDGDTPSWAASGVQAGQVVRVAAIGDRTLWFVPARSVWCVGLAASSGLMSTACSPRDGSQPSLEASLAGDPRDRSSQPLVVFGWAAAPADRVEVRFADGTSQPLPLSQGFFLWQAGGPLDSRPATLAALAADGSLVDERPLFEARIWNELMSPPPPALPPASSPSQHVQVDLAGAAADVAINDDGTCGGWTMAGDVGTSESEVVRLDVLGSDGADDGGTLLGTLDGRSLIIGDTGAGAASAALVLSDGSEQPVSLHERCVLVAVAPADDTAALHPTALRWRDAGGAVHDAAVDATWPTFATDAR